jgi:two-component system cell cycle sensor histidine kinase/response regulator CckA
MVQRFRRNPVEHSASHERALRVLLVEHEPVDVELCTAALRSAGYALQIDVVATPKDYVHQLDARTYDVVLSDYNIPGWSGMDALHILRDAGDETPFLLVTGALGEEVAVSCIQQGVSDYILKDRLARLPYAIDRAIGEQRLREERNRSGLALRHSEERYRELVDNAIYGIYRETVHGRFLQVNPALVRMLGYESSKEMMDLSALAAYRYPKDRERLLLEEYHRTGRVIGVEVEWKRKDGLPLLVRLSGRGVPNTSGDLQELEIIVEDVTERRALEKQLHQVRKFEAIGQLAGGIAHDFNNVIGAMMGWAELGSEQAPADSRLSEYFKKIRTQAGRAAGLTRQLLAFARRQILEPQDIQLNTVVTDVLSLLEKVIGTDVEIRTSLAAELSPVRADSSQIEQVLMNLCLNARDAMPSGGCLTIQTRNTNLDEAACRRTPGLSPGRHAELIVSDDGIGMDAKTREHIFEPFFTTKELGKGTGLGLATVFGIIRQHGGFVSVDSEPNHGATFRIYLPVVKSAAVDLAQSNFKPDETVLRGGKETLLVADDHEGIREMMRSALEGCGYRVLLAVNGEEAIRTFENHSREISLVVVDMVMPRIGGLEAAKRMQQIRPELPIIFTTGYSSDNEALTKVIAAGGVVVEKPFDPGKLARRVRELLDASLVHSQSHAPNQSE